VSKKILIFLGLLLFGACTPKISEVISDDDFTASDTSAQDILSTLPEPQNPVHVIQGRAKAQMSGPDYSEQGTVQFVSDRQQSLLAIRNNLGIEGGRIYTDRDSVTVYDRIEKSAWRIGIEESHQKLLNGFTAFNLLDFLIPELFPADVKYVFENDGFWSLHFWDGKKVYIEKNTGFISEMITQTTRPDAFNHFRFMNYAKISGIELPRRIQILSNDRKSNIFLLIQALEVNPESPDFDIKIPQEIPINR